MWTLLFRDAYHLKTQHRGLKYCRRSRHFQLSHLNSCSQHEVCKSHSLRTFTDSVFSPCTCFVGAFFGLCISLIHSSPHSCPRPQLSSLVCLCEWCIWVLPLVCMCVCVVCPLFLVFVVAMRMRGPKSTLSLHCTYRQQQSFADTWRCPKCYYPDNIVLHYKRVGLG